MKRTLLVAAAILFATAGTSLSAQTAGQRIMSMEFGTVFGYDLDSDTVESATSYSFLLHLSPNLAAGASFLQGTGVMNASFFRIEYSLDEAIGVQLFSGLYNTALGYGVGAEYAVAGRSFGGLTTALTVSLQYYISSTLGIDNGTTAVGISAALGL